MAHRKRPVNRPVRIGLWPVWRKARTSPLTSRQSVLALALVLMAAGLLTSCRPLYLPPIPAEVPFTTQVRSTSASGVSIGPRGYPTIELELINVSEAGWLAVQWLTPKGSEAASESVWVEAATEQSVNFTLPTDVELRSGDWRAVVSLNGQLVRQLNFTIELPD